MNGPCKTPDYQQIDTMIELITAQTNAIERLCKIVQFGVGQVEEHTFQKATSLDEFIKTGRSKLAVVNKKLHHVETTLSEILK